MEREIMTKGLDQAIEPAVMVQIDRAIKEVWKKDIVRDYHRDYILFEDTLKNALYYHLRKRLNSLLKGNDIRIFTEFNTGPLAGEGVKADMAIVKINDNEELHLKDRIERVYAVIELKYKGEHVPQEYFWHDVHKVLGLIKHKMLKDCQFYLGFVHEYEYEPDEDSWLNIKEQNRAKGRLTELSASYYTDREDIRFTVVSHNGLNSDLNDSF